MPSPASISRRLNPMVAVAAATCLAALASAHPDDPKVRDKMPRYEGPGWTESSDAPGPGFDAVGATLRSWITLPEFGINPASGNDCWGWTSPAGREYALMGLNNGTAFVDVTDPGAPVIRDVVPGPSSLWRDVKTYQNFAYVVTEASGGNVQVIDLSQLDTTGEAILVNTVGGTGTSSTHNVAIDTDSGFLYRSGGGSEGIRILDLADPANPVQVASWSTKYVHDLQARTMTGGPFAGRQLVFLCSGFNGGFVDTGLTILDVTDKSNIVVLDEFLYPFSAYSHQAWLTEDETRLYLNDELDEGEYGIGSTIHVFDVSDPADIVYEGAFTNGNPAIGHNLYIKGDRMYAAHYRSGVRVFDLASDPLAPEEIAYFDTFPGDDAPAFNGAWSVYPYFESGTVIISDLERGLFVVEFAEPRVAISYPGGRPELVDPAGQAVQATIEELVSGELAEATVELVVDSGAGGLLASPMAPLGDGTWEGTLPPADCGSTVRWWIRVTFADEASVTSPSGAPASAWTALAAAGTTTILADDGETPGGWTVTNVEITGGAWERGVPAGGGLRGDPATDFDGSGSCWLTENGPGNTDVDGGPTILTSAPISVPADALLVLRYARWFTNDDGDGDRLRTELSVDGGTNWILVEETGDQAGWVERTVRLDELASIAGSIRLRFLATDNPNNSVTEAAIDAVRLEVLECAAPTVPEDVNGDGVVDFGDLLEVLATFGPCAGTPCPADVTGDLAVTFDDLLAVLAAWS